MNKDNPNLRTDEQNDSLRLAIQSYERLKEENLKLVELVRVGLDMVEQLKDQGCLPGEVDTFTEKANQLLGDKVKP